MQTPVGIGSSPHMAVFTTRSEFAAEIDWMCSVRGCCIAHASTKENGEPYQVGVAGESARFTRRTTGDGKASEKRDTFATEIHAKLILESKRET